MTPALALAAAFLFSPAAPAAADVPSTLPIPAAGLQRPNFIALFRDAKTSAAQAYLTGQPVEQALTFQKIADLLEAIPKGPDAPDIGLAPDQAREQIDNLRRLREQATAVQAGRAADDPPAIFAQTIVIAGEGLLGRPPTEDERKKLVALYGARVRDAKAAQKPKSQGELTMDAEAARRVLQDPKLDPKIAGAVTAKSGQYAQALGGLLYTDGQGNALIVGRRDPRAPLTQAELDRIASMPRVQMPGGLVDLNKKVPAPVSQISQHAPQMGEPGFEYGWATSAYKYWNDMANAQGDMVSDGKRGVLAATAVYTGATVMKGFYHMSGFGAVEQSYNQLQWDKNRDASTGTLVWSGTKLVGNTALAALNFVPVFSAVSKGATIVRGAKAGTEIVELGGGVGRATAAEGANEIRQAISSSVSGSAAKMKDARAILGGLQKAGAKYGVEVVEDRSLLGAGMAEGDASRIVINTRIGAAHEVTHAVQQTQLRITLLKQFGKPYNELSAAEKALFAERVQAMETVGYNQFEQGAFRATGFMGSGSLNPWRYARGLEQNIAGFEGGLASGTVPKIGAQFWQRPTMVTYGELPVLLGRSQLEIAKNMAYATNTFGRASFPIVNDAVGVGVDKAMTWYMAGSPGQ